ncbi:hypothetical protein SDC9_74104 [bioreactor metagenome]|uniref:Uncharacterized protein n=1 Tax=bioreactor metagenome TaxID=1076179 RepID=A0A644YI76_9ZZZZ
MNLCFKTGERTGVQHEPALNRRHAELFGALDLRAARGDDALRARKPVQRVHGNLLCGVAFDQVDMDDA